MKRLFILFAVLIGLAITSSAATAGWVHRAYARGYVAGATFGGPVVVGGPVYVARPVYYRGPAFYPRPAFYPGPMYYGGPAYYGAYPAYGVGGGFY